MFHARYKINSDSNPVRSSIPHASEMTVDKANRGLSKFRQVRRENHVETTKGGFTIFFLFHREIHTLHPSLIQACLLTDQ